MSTVAFKSELSDCDKSFQLECIELAGTAAGVLLALVVLKPMFGMLDPLMDALYVIIAGAM